MTISEYIKAKGLTASYVAKQMGVKRQTISYYSNGKYNPSLRTLTRIAGAMTELGVSTTVADIVAAINIDDKGGDGKK